MTEQFAIGTVVRFTPLDDFYGRVVGFTDSVTADGRGLVYVIEGATGRPSVAREVDLATASADDTELFNQTERIYAKLSGEVTQLPVPAPTFETATETDWTTALTELDFEGSGEHASSEPIFTIDAEGGTLLSVTSNNCSSCNTTGIVLHQDRDDLVIPAQFIPELVTFLSDHLARGGPSTDPVA